MRVEGYGIGYGPIMIISETVVLSNIVRGEEYLEQWSEPFVGLETKDHPRNVANDRLDINVCPYPFRNHTDGGERYVGW